MRRIQGAVFALSVLAIMCALPARAEGARFQYDELRIRLAAGQPAPGPDAFDQQYAAARDHFARTASVAALKADAASKREAAMKALAGPGMGERAAGMLMGQVTDLISSANPIAGMVFGMLAGAARGQGSDHAKLGDAARQAEDDARREESARPGLRRISIWDHWLRVDDLDDGSAVITKPDRNEYFVLDTRQKTWVRLAEAPISDVAKQVTADPARCTYPSGEQATRIEPRVIAGHEAEGYRGIERMAYDASQTMVMENIYYLSNQRIPDESLALLNGIPPCPAGSPARQTAVPDDRVTFYQAMTTHFEDAQGQRVADIQVTTDMVFFEQRLRTLDETARDALFTVPADYRELR